MHRRRVGWRGAAPGPNRPYRLVRNHNFGNPDLRQLADANFELLLHNRLGSIHLPLRERLPHAEHRCEAECGRDCNFLSDVEIRLTEDMSSLRVSYEAQLRPGVSRDGRRVLTGERSLVAR